MGTSARFWDRIAERYSRKPVADEAAYQRKLEVTREYFRPDMQVLEIGCGTGSTAIAHAPYVKQIRATDLSAKMIDIAKRKAAAQNIRNVSFEQSAVEHLGIANETLDAVLGLSVLHLLEDRDAAIKTVYDMLKPGGIFVSSTVCLGDTMKWFRFIGPLGRMLGLMPLVRIFSRQELEDSLSAAGFESEHVWQPDDGRVVFIVARKPGIPALRPGQS